MVFGRVLEPEADFAIIEDVGIDKQLGDFIVVDGTAAGTVCPAVGLFIGDKPMLVAGVFPC